MCIKGMNIKAIRLFLMTVLLCFTSLSQAAIEAYEFKTPEMEAEYNQLIGELRCLVCQNQKLIGFEC